MVANVYIVNSIQSSVTRRITDVGETPKLRLKVAIEQIYVTINSSKASSSHSFEMADTESRGPRIRNKIPRFRVLIMGRANAGKTTILQRVCKTTESPEVFDGKGNKVGPCLYVNPDE